MENSVEKIAPDSARAESIKALAMRMLRVVAISYAINTLILFGFVFLGIVPATIPLLFFLTGVCTCGAYGVAVSSGWSRRFKDSSLTLPHVIVSGGIVQTIFLALAPQVGFLFLFNLVMSTVFCVLSLNVRQFIVIWALIVVAVGAVFASVGALVDFQVSSRFGQLLVWLHFSFTLGVCAYMNSLVGGLRKKLNKTNRELQASFIQIEERTRELTEKNAALEEEIIERKAAEQAAQQERDFSQALVQSIPEIFFLLGQKKRILMYNPNSILQLGLDADTAPNACPILDFVDERDQARVDAMLDAALEHSNGDCEAGLLFTGARTAPHYLIARRVLIQETPHLIIIGFDITGQRKVEEEMRHLARAAEAANRAKSEFLAMMSHEIRTPMNAVLGLTELALRTDLDFKQRDYLEKINSSATTLLGILNDILDFSKIEAGQLDIQRVEFDLSAIFRKVSDVASLHAVEKNLELLYWVDPDVPARLVGDPLRLEQVLLNLVSNAIKFTERGEVLIRLGIVRRLEDEVELVCLVSDTGIGISEDQRGRLFQAFTQADASTTRRFGGTGLGLVISQQLVKLMGGVIQFCSEPESGSTFSFSVVLGSVVPDSPAQHAGLARAAGKRVLVVDDNARAREVLGAILGAWAMQVGTAASGVEALMMARQAAESGQPFDLVLMDAGMPGLDGLETLRIMRRQDSSLRIIAMLQAYQDGEIIERASDLGAAAVLIKPIENSLLLGAVATVLDTARASSPPAAVQAKPPRPAFAGVRILLAEDDKINQQVAMELLSGLGVAVDVVDNGWLALLRLLEQGNVYDAVLTDIRMPEMDGLELTRQIRSQHGNARLPIIALTAHAFSDERRCCLAAGMNDYITKPIDSALLREVLNRWLPECADARSSEAATTCPVVDVLTEPAVKDL